jgi:hypothetical protein
MTKNAIHENEAAGTLYPEAHAHVPTTSTALPKNISHEETTGLRNRSRALVKHKLSVAAAIVHGPAVERTESNNAPASAITGVARAAAFLAARARSRPMTVQNPPRTISGP